jgi:hypothetical protein
MTAPSGGARYGGDASAVVGYTYLSRSYSGPESTDRAPGIAPGARASEAPASPSTSTASRDVAPRLVSVRVLEGVTIKVGRLRREQLSAFRYDDGTEAVGYPVYGPGRSFVVVPVPWPDSDRRGRHE